MLEDTDEVSAWRWTEDEIGAICESVLVELVKEPLQLLKSAMRQQYDNELLVKIILHRISNLS